MENKRIKGSSNIINQSQDVSRMGLTGGLAHAGDQNTQPGRIDKYKS